MFMHDLHFDNLVFYCTLNKFDFSFPSLNVLQVNVAYFMSCDIYVSALLVNKLTCFNFGPRSLDLKIAK